MYDPDIFYKPMTDADGFEYYSYMILYVDYILLIMKDPKEAMPQIQERFTVKPFSIKEPKSCLKVDINETYYRN